MDLAITGANIILRDCVLENGTLIVFDGVIQGYGPEGSMPVAGMQVVHADGAYLIPGIVDSHNDGVEEEINPRPRANFPMEFAISNYEMRALSAGVTTAFHAVMFADLQDKERSIRGATAVADSLHGLQNPLIDHEVLYRLDVWTPDGMDPMFSSMRKARVQAMALNDHTPGQGQYRDIDEYKKTLSAYLAKAAIKVDSEEAARLIQRRTRTVLADRPVEVLQRTQEELAKEPFILLGHDPDSAEKIDELAAMGVTIAEFPVTHEAAERARQVGQCTTMGAPNIVRGGSTSGNLSAVTLAKEGLLDILCGDYHAHSLLYATMLLHQKGVCSLPDAIAMITSNPAKAFGLHDRGRIELGCIADLCLFTVDNGIPRVTTVFKNGNAVYSGGVGIALQPTQLSSSTTTEHLSA